MTGKNSKRGSDSSPHSLLCLGESNPFSQGSKRQGEVSETVFTHQQFLQKKRGFGFLAQKLSGENYIQITIQYVLYVHTQMSCVRQLQTYVQMIQENVFFSYAFFWRFGHQKYNNILFNNLPCLFLHCCIIRI